MPGAGGQNRTDNLRAIPNGYRLPSNTVQVSSSVTNGVQDLRFGLTWKAPFNVNLLWQTYIKSNGYDWGANTFNATGFEITFSHTGSSSGSIGLSENYLAYVKKMQGNTAMPGWQARTGS